MCPLLLIESNASESVILLDSTYGDRKRAENEAGDFHTRHDVTS